MKQDQQTGFDMDQLLSGLIGGNLVILLLALFIILCIFLAIRIVPQSEQHVVERFGRLKRGAGAGDKLYRAVPRPGRAQDLDPRTPAAHGRTGRDHRRQRSGARSKPASSTASLEPEKTVYRIRDVDAAIATTVAGIVRSEIGKMELDEVQSNRATLIATIKIRVSVRAMSMTGGLR
jgi:regulator of protease activity HflC (stomatin/prohibitin superfamily)